MLSTNNDRFCKFASNLAKIIIAFTTITLLNQRQLDANYAEPESGEAKRAKTATIRNYSTSYGNSIYSQATMLSLLLEPAHETMPNEQIELALGQLAPDLRQLRDFTLKKPMTKGVIFNESDSDDATSLRLSLEAWKLMRNQAQKAVNSRLQFAEPILIEFLNEAQVSGECLSASRSTLNSAKNLESWAIQRKLE